MAKKLDFQQNPFYLKAVDFVDSSFGKKKSHFDRTVFWLLELDPFADLATIVAAYGHDVERAFHPKEKKRLLYDDPLELELHQRKSAEIMRDFCCKNEHVEIAGRVYDLISRHEIGGSEIQNLLKDADSISYLEVNAPRHIAWIPELPEGEFEKKVSWMYRRITSREAKKIAAPIYQKLQKYF